jgi:hypothetical protein
MEYIREGATLPVPFNIIPSPKAIIRIFYSIINCKKRNAKEPKNESDRNKKISQNLNVPDDNAMVNRSKMKIPTGFLF